MYMRMRFIGVQHHCIPVFEPEFLPGKVLHRTQHLVRRRSRRHREHELVSQLRRRPTRPRLEVGLTPMLFQVQIPVLQKLLLDPFTRQSLAIVRLDVHLSSSIQVAEVASYRFEILPSPAEHFDHDFRSPAYRATNQLDLVLRQAISSTWSPPGVARDVEERPAAADLNESSGHGPAPTRPGWPIATPSRGCEDLPPP